MSLETENRPGDQTETVSNNKDSIIGQEATPSIPESDDSPMGKLKGKENGIFPRIFKARILAAGGFNTLPTEETERIRNEVIAEIIAKRNQPSESAVTTGDSIEVHRGQVRIAYWLAALYEGKLLHVHGIGWHHWDGTRWAEDIGGHTKRAVLAVLRQALSESVDDKTLRDDVRKSESANGIKGVLEIAAALEQFAATVDDLDTDPYLLNCANGTLDMRTMQLRPHNPADRITKITRGNHRPDAIGTTWTKFLARSLPDTLVREFLQRYVGHALVGTVLEHILGILTGDGGNGKGVFEKALEHSLGDYASAADPDLFMQRDGAHPTGQMDLRGRRFVTVSESDRNRQLAEATMKRLTGGDRIKARLMRKDFVEFEPSHTVTLVTNHLPKVAGDDPAIWRRLRVVPFDVVIPVEERDSKLGEKLQAEADAVLAWAIAGWQDYQQQGLAEPEAVTRATDAYKADSDAVGRFIQDRCDIGGGLSSLTETLHHAWTDWAREEGIQPISKQEFGKSLEKRGYMSKRGAKGVRVRLGIALQPEPIDESQKSFFGNG